MHKLEREGMCKNARARLGMSIRAVKYGEEGVRMHWDYYMEGALKRLYVSTYTKYYPYKVCFC